MNRLLRHDTGSNVYTYDAHGNILTMPHLQLMAWDYKGNLVETRRTGSNYSTYYRYDAEGNRVRKVTVNGTTREERIYIGNYEVYRKTIGGVLNTERQSSFVSDDTKRIAIVDTRTTPTPVQVTMRYQHYNHLGSACLELDGNGAIISYEEYHPFGTTSYRAGASQTEVERKRYKYVGKERDEETGLYYYGARYYAAWLCRFVSVDPLQFKYPELTPFQYASNRPISRIDLDGLEAAEPIKNVGDPGYVSLQTLTKFRDGLIQGGYLNHRTEPTASQLKTTFSVRDNIKVSGLYQNYRPMLAAKAAEIEEIKMHNLRQYKDPGSINPARSNLEKWSSIMIPPEARSMVQYDPVIKGIAVGTLASGALVSTSYLLQTSLTTTSLISGGTDFLSQMAFKKWDFNEWNMSQTASSMIFKLPYVQSVLGSSLDIRFKSLFTDNEPLLENTIFGNKNSLTFVNEAIIGGTFNKIGKSSITNSNSLNGITRTMQETHNLMVSYMLSNYLSGEVQKVIK